jgi:hypothetical protein
MNSNHIEGKFFRVIHSPETQALSPGAYLVLLYLYRQFAREKTNPACWDEREAEIDSRTLRSAVAELIHHGFIEADYTLLNPMTRSPFKYPKPGKRFEGVKTFSFPWLVLDYRRLNASELKLYAVLWAEKNHRSYLSDHEIAFATGFSEATVRRCLQALRAQRLITCRTEPRAWFKRIRNKSFRLRTTLADEVVTVIRQITLCDPERPGCECTARGLYSQYLDFREIRPGDVRSLLHRLGVKVISDNGEVIHCEMPFGRTNEYRKVDPQSGFSIVPTSERTRNGEPRFARESVWEMAHKYSGAEGYQIVQKWHDSLVRRNLTREVTA